MSNVMYSQDNNGKWWKTVWKPQCPEKIILWGRCQGVKGHAGNHWNFSPCGSYNYAHAKGGGGSIPPGHKSWISPIKKIDEYHLKFSATTPVRSRALIAKLESGAEVEGSVTRPCTDEEIKELWEMGRLDETPKSVRKQYAKKFGPRKKRK